MHLCIVWRSAFLAVFLVLLAAHGGAKTEAVEDAASPWDGERLMPMSDLSGSRDGLSRINMGRIAPQVASDPAWAEAQHSENGDVSYKALFSDGHDSHWYLDVVFSDAVHHVLPGNDTVSFRAMEGSLVAHPDSRFAGYELSLFKADEHVSHMAFEYHATLRAFFTWHVRERPGQQIASVEAQDGVVNTMILRFASRVSQSRCTGVRCAYEALLARPYQPVDAGIHVDRPILFSGEARATSQPSSSWVGLENYWSHQSPASFTPSSVSKHSENDASSFLMSLQDELNPPQIGADPTSELRRLQEDVSDHAAFLGRQTNLYITPLRNLVGGADGSAPLEANGPVNVDAIYPLLEESEERLRTVTSVTVLAEVMASAGDCQRSDWDSFDLRYRQDGNSTWVSLPSPWNAGLQTDYPLRADDVEGSVRHWNVSGLQPVLGGEYMAALSPPCSGLAARTLPYSVKPRDLLPLWSGPAYLDSAHPVRILFFWTLTINQLSDLHVHIGQEGDSALHLVGLAYFYQCRLIRDACPNSPKIRPGQCGCDVRDTDTDLDGVADCVDPCPANIQLFQSAGPCGDCRTFPDMDGDNVVDCHDLCPHDANKIYPGVCGCGEDDTLDSDLDGIPNCIDVCPYGGVAGPCGCIGATQGASECQDLCPLNPYTTNTTLACQCRYHPEDSDNDGVLDCEDRCPHDPNKVRPGVCDCGVSDQDSDMDGKPDCIDGCPFDARKTSQGACGCGRIDKAPCNPLGPGDAPVCPQNPCGCGADAIDSDGDGVADCNDACPHDPNKFVSAEECGCGQGEEDRDGDQIEDCRDVCPDDPNKGLSSGWCGCGVDESLDSDRDGVPDCADACPFSALKWRAPGFCGCDVLDTDMDADGQVDCFDVCPEHAPDISPNHCGCGNADVVDENGLCISIDECPDSEIRTRAGRCGCESTDPIGEMDFDGDGVVNCLEVCYLDPQKQSPDICGCGFSDRDSDLDGTADCLDGCPFNSLLIRPTECGCEVPFQVYRLVDGINVTMNTCPRLCPLYNGLGAPVNVTSGGSCIQPQGIDHDHDGWPDQIDACPLDRLKTNSRGACGCGRPETDTDRDGVPDCIDRCPLDPMKIKPGRCGCGVSDRSPDSACLGVCPVGSVRNAPGECGCDDESQDRDSDMDGVADCLDACPFDPYKSATQGWTGCGQSSLDSDGDGIPDVYDVCPNDPLKAFSVGQCGCGVSELDSDGDRVADCRDRCPFDHNKNNPGVCGCGVRDWDTDGDLVLDCSDMCPTDPSKWIRVGQCGCGVREVDSDGDGIMDCLDECPLNPDLNKLTRCGCVEEEFGSVDPLVPLCLLPAPNPLDSSCAAEYVEGREPRLNTDGDAWDDCVDVCSEDPNKQSPLQCGCGESELDTDSDGAADCVDACVQNPLRNSIDLCDCSVAETDLYLDSDGDGLRDCLDICPQDRHKLLIEGPCGCGQVDTYHCLSECNENRDSDGDGWNDCEDACPLDDAKWLIEDTCGCGLSEVDTDMDGVKDCLDECPFDEDKTCYGICGCSVPDIDTDGDGVMDCEDSCPLDGNKSRPDICGCGVADIDSDGDGVVDCLDECPRDCNKSLAGVCGCHVSEVDTDMDGVKDCLDECPTTAGIYVRHPVCGCVPGQIDSDGDGVLDCQDECPDNADLQVEGPCGCEGNTLDTDADSVVDCLDECPLNPDKTLAGHCGCETPEVHGCCECRGLIAVSLIWRHGREADVVLRVLGSSGYQVFSERIEDGVDVFTIMRDSTAPPAINNMGRVGLSFNMLSPEIVLDSFMMPGACEGCAWVEGDRVGSGTEDIRVIRVSTLRQGSGCTTGCSDHSQSLLVDVSHNTTSFELLEQAKAAIRAVAIVHWAGDCNTPISVFTLNGTVNTPYNSLCTSLDMSQFLLQVNSLSINSSSGPTNWASSTLNAQAAQVSPGEIYLLIDRLNIAAQSNIVWANVAALGNSIVPVAINGSQNAGDPSAAYLQEVSGGVFVQYDYFVRPPGRYLLTSTLLRATELKGCCDEQKNACGVCHGDSTSCLDCRGVVRGPAEYDHCGVCDGDGSACTPPALEPNCTHTTIRPLPILDMGDLWQITIVMGQDDSDDTSMVFTYIGDLPDAPQTIVASLLPVTECPSPSAPLSSDCFEWQVDTQGRPVLTASLTDLLSVSCGGNPPALHPTGVPGAYTGAVYSRVCGPGSPEPAMVHRTAFRLQISFSDASEVVFQHGMPPGQANIGLVWLQYVWLASGDLMILLQSTSTEGYSIGHPRVISRCCDGMPYHIPCCTLYDQHDSEGHYEPECLENESALVPAHTPCTQQWAIRTYGAVAALNFTGCTVIEFTVYYNGVEVGTYCVTVYTEVVRRHVLEAEATLPATIEFFRDPDYTIGVDSHSNVPSRFGHEDRVYVQVSTSQGMIYDVQINSVFLRELSSGPNALSSTPVPTNGTDLILYKRRPFYHNAYFDLVFEEREDHVPGRARFSYIARALASPHHHLNVSWSLSRHEILGPEHNHVLSSGTHRSDPIHASRFGGLQNHLIQLPVFQYPEARYAELGPDPNGNHTAKAGLALRDSVHPHARPHVADEFTNSPHCSNALQAMSVVCADGHYLYEGHCYVEMVLPRVILVILFVIALAIFFALVVWVCFVISSCSHARGQATQIEVGVSSHHHQGHHKKHRVHFGSDWNPELDRLA